VKGVKRGRKRYGVNKNGMANTFRRRRKYTGVSQYFHNYEHDPTGRNHCKSSGQHPYTIKHVNGRHVISNAIATGHGLGGKPQVFKFTKRVPGGYDMTSGKKVSKNSK